ncbi:hypothetical protein HNP00_001086 [Arthrobacter sp. AZCC_0090]|nr:hypothetical protein [Arthrobacter sp. AZCC_0090]
MWIFVRIKISSIEYIFGNQTHPRLAQAKSRGFFTHVDNFFFSRISDARIC